MTTSTELTLSLSFPFWSNFKTLPIEQKNKFTASLYRLLINNYYQIPLPKSIYDKSVISLCNEDKLILIVIYMSEAEEMIAKIIDYIPSEKQETIEKAVPEFHNLIVKTKSIVLENIEFQGWGEIDCLNQTYEIKMHHLLPDDDDFWVYFLNNKTKEECDLLSTEQFKVVRSALPAILVGDRGTGKTTTALYSALNQARQISKKGNEKVLYVSENKSSAKQLKKISNHHNKTSNLEFFSFLKLSKLIIDKYPLIFTKKFLAQREINFYKFSEQFFKPKKIFALSAEELWREIKYLIKGSNRAIRKNKSLLTLADYIGLKKQSTLPENTDFKFVYDLAVQYQEWLESQKFWDVLDLTRYLINQLPDNYLGEYKAVYIDGIEQFSAIQTRLLFKLLKAESIDTYIPQLFLIGNQEISSLQNNYTWNRVKKLIIDSYHKLPQWKVMRSLIEPQEFIYSFVHLNTITQLGSTVANFAGKNIHHSSWLRVGKKPLVISDINDDFFLHKSSLNIDCAIIVFNQEEKDKLGSFFTEDKERIILFSQSEHLDFEQVLIWKLFEYCSNLQESKNLTTQELELLKHEYTAICTSKAKKNIYFYDHQIDEFWNQENINDLIEIGYQSELESLFNQEYSEEKIAQITDRFLHKENLRAYKIASQIYDRYHKKIGKERVSALLEEIKGNYGKAGDIWNKLEIFDEAINSWNEVDSKLWLAKWSVLNEHDWQKRGNYFETEKDYDLAKFCFDKANYFEGKLRCLEADDQWELAADECQEKGLMSQAHKYYRKADKFYRQHGQTSLAIRMWTKLSKWEEVALIWQDLEQWEKAGNCWQKFGDMQRAAFCWQKAEKWVQAQKCWQELGNWQELALSYETQENWELAAHTWLKVIDEEKAAICYEKANLWDQAEEIWTALGYWGFVAICLQQQQKWSEAAEAWSKTNPNELQALCYEKCEDWANAEKCWLEAKNWLRIILACEKQDKWLEAAESWENLGEWKNAAQAWQKIEETEKAALCYEEAQDWLRAEECWRKLYQDDRLAQVLEKQGEWSQAAVLWQALSQWDHAGTAWLESGEVEKAALCYEEGNHWREAEACWRELENWSKVDHACEKQGQWQKAANDWLKSSQWEKAALCYEKCQDWEKAINYWAKCQNWEKLAYGCQQLEQWESAAQAYIKIDQVERAGLCYEKAENWTKAEECWRQLYKWDKLAIVCEYQSKWIEAGKSWLIVNEIESAALCYEKCENWTKAEECWRQLNNWEKLASVCEKKDEWEEAAQLWYFLEKWEKAAEACLQMDDMETAIKYYQKGGYHQKAQELLSVNS